MSAWYPQRRSQVLHGVWSEVGYLDMAVARTESMRCECRKRTANPKGLLKHDAGDQVWHRFTRYDDSLAHLAAFATPSGLSEDGSAPTLTRQVLRTQHPLAFPQAKQVIVVSHLAGCMKLNKGRSRYGEQPGP